jgi:hypothetical protein
MGWGFRHVDTGNRAALLTFRRGVRREMRRRSARPAAETIGALLNILQEVAVVGLVWGIREMHRNTLAPPEKRIRNVCHHTYEHANGMLVSICRWTKPIKSCFSKRYGRIPIDFAADSAATRLIFLPWSLRHARGADRQMGCASRNCLCLTGTVKNRRPRAKIASVATPNNQAAGWRLFSGWRGEASGWRIRPSRYVSGRAHCRCRLAKGGARSLANRTHARAIKPRQ